MRFLSFKSGGTLGIGVATGSGEVRGLLAGEPGYPGRGARALSREMRAPGHTCATTPGGARGVPSS